MQREQFESTKLQSPSASSNENRTLVSLDDFKSAANCKRNSTCDLANLRDMDLHLSFDGTGPNGPMSLDQSVHFKFNIDDAQHLDFGDVKKLFSDAFDPLESALANMYAGNQKGNCKPGSGGSDCSDNRGDNTPPHPGHVDDKQCDKPGRDNPGHHNPGHDNPVGDPWQDPDQPGWPNGFLFGGNAHNSLDSIQSAIGGRANLEMFPVRPDDAAGLRHVQEDLLRGVTPEVSLNGEPFEHGSRGIAAGEYDAALTRMARDMADMRGPDGRPGDILMRFGKEMNLQHAFVGSNEDFVRAFQHVSDIFHREAPNVKMVWCPTKKVDPSGLGEEPDPSKYWPGARYVDVVGPDGYSGLYGRAQSFQEIFQPFADFSRRIGKPFMTSETNVKTPMSDVESAQWWRDAYRYVMGERARGTNIIGVGVFARNEGEILSEAERQALRDTFIRQEGS